MLRLGFARIPDEVPENFRATPDAALIHWVADQLVRQGAVREHGTGTGTSYTMTDTGLELLAATEQYDADNIPSGLSLCGLNELLAAARHAPLTSGSRVEVEPRPQAPPAGPGVVPPPPTGGTTDAPVTPAIVLQVFEELRGSRFAGDGVVPIHELRRRLVERHGSRAGSHESLDPLLKQLRRERRLRLIAIGDYSRATPEQLADSVPGDNETFFSVEAAHEHAPAH
jgi:hypothetical protein